MAQQSFVQRLLDVSVKLAPQPGTNQPGSFAESGTDTTTLQGSRASARIENSGAPIGSTATVRVWGLTPSIMNQLATLGMVFNIVERNTLTVQAGDAASGMSPVFSGTATAAYVDYDGAPDVPFHFECNSGLADAVAPASASSFTGATDVATIMAGFARQMNVGFENNGVQAQLASPYFPGNLWTQMRACAEHAGINAEVINGVLAIWPRGASRSSVTTVPVVSPDTGMIGYPSFTQNGIIVKTLYNPQIAFGGMVQVKSKALSAAAQSKSANATTILPADGLWAVYKLDHALESRVPKGNWMSTAYCFNPKYPRPVSPGARG